MSYVMLATFNNAKHLSTKEKSDNNATFPTYYNVCNAAMNANENEPFQILLFLKKQNILCS